MPWLLTQSTPREHSGLKEAGAKAILSVYTVGGITEPTWVPGTLVVPHQLIDYTWGREQSYSLEGEVLHVDFTNPYDETLRQALLTAAAPCKPRHLYPWSAMAFMPPCRDPGWKPPRKSTGWSATGARSWA